MKIQRCVAEINYIFNSAVKISTLTQAIHFFSLTHLNYLTPLTQGQSLVLATPLITANSVSFFLTRSAFFQSQNVFTSTSNWRRFRRALQLHFSIRRESNERGNCTVLAACALQYTHKGAGACIACILSYQIAKENEHVMS